MERVQDGDSCNDLRLEDISRRSACDRCRGMKTRCERSHGKGIAQLAQCRRCVQAQAKCITTIEAQPQRRQPGDMPGPGNLKRHRTASFESYSHDFDVDQPQHNMLLDYTSAGLTTDIAPPALMPPSFRPETRLAPPQDLSLDNWHEFGDMMNLEGASPTQDLNNNEITRPASASGSGSITVHPPVSGDYISGQLSSANSFQSNTTLYSMPESHRSTWSPHGTSRSSWSSQSQPSTYITALQAPPLEHENSISNVTNRSNNTDTTSTTNMNRINRSRSGSSGKLSGSGENSSDGDSDGSGNIINRLMKLNMALSRDVQKAQAATQTRREDPSGRELGSILVGTLQHSQMFLRLIGSLTRPGINLGSDGDDEVVNRTGGSSEDPADRGGKVSTDVALHVLSCNMAIASLYEIVCSELVTASDPQLGNGGVEGQQQQQEDDEDNEQEIGDREQIRDSRQRPMQRHMRKRTPTQGLPEFRLEGLQSVDAEMHVSVLAHICALMFLRIQKVLCLMRRQNMLTQTAETTFTAVLGGNDHKGSEIVDNLRRLVLGAPNTSTGT